MRDYPKRPRPRRESRWNASHPQAINSFHKLRRHLPNRCYSHLHKSNKPDCLRDPNCVTNPVAAADGVRGNAEGRRARKQARSRGESRRQCAGGCGKVHGLSFSDDVSAQRGVHRESVDLFGCGAAEVGGVDQLRARGVDLGEEAVVVSFQLRLGGIRGGEVGRVGNARDIGAVSAVDDDRRRAGIGRECGGGRAAQSRGVGGVRARGIRA